MTTFKLDESHCDTALAGADLSAQLHKLVKKQGDGTVVLCGSGEIPVGSIVEAAAQGYAVSFHFGAITKVIAGGSITAGQKVQSGANGVVTAGTVNTFGTARTSAESGELVSVYWGI